MEILLEFKTHGQMDSATSPILEKDPAEGEGNLVMITMVTMMAVMVTEARLPSRNHRLGRFLPLNESKARRWQ